MDDFEAIDPQVALISSHSAWGCNIKTARCPSYPPICRVSGSEFFLIVGCRLAVYDRVTNRPTLMLTLPSIHSFHNIYSSKNEKFLAAIVKPVAVKRNEATLAIFDFSRNNGSNFHQIAPKLLKHKYHSEDIDENYEFESIVFNGDGQFIACSTNIIEDGVLIFKTLRGELAHHIPLQHGPITAISFHPTDSSKLCVTGHDGLIIFWRYVKQNTHSAPIIGLPTIHEEDSTGGRFHPHSGISYTCHAWVAENLVIAGNDIGMLLLIQGCEVVFTIKDAFHLNNPSDDPDIATINHMPSIVSQVLVRNNIIVATCSSKSLIVMYEVKRFLSSSRQEVSAKLLVLARYRYTEESIPSVLGIEWCNKQEISNDEVLAVTENGILLFDLKTADCSKRRMLEYSSTAQGDSNANSASNVWTTLRSTQTFFSYHHHPIHSLSLSSRTSTLMTMSADDGLISIKNYNEDVHEKCSVLLDITAGEGNKIFHTALHPTGLYVACGSETFVGEYAVTDKKLKYLRRVDIKLPFYITVPGSHIVHVNTQPATIVKYSIGGHLLGVVTGKILRIYHMYALDFANPELVGVPALIFASTEHNAYIVDFTFCNQDQRVIVVCLDGSAHSWNIADSVRDQEYIMKGYLPLSLASGKREVIVSYHLQEAFGGAPGASALMSPTLAFKTNTAHIARKSTFTFQSTVGSLKAAKDVGSASDESTSIATHPGIATAASPTHVDSVKKHPHCLAIWRDGKISNDPDIVILDQPVSSLAIGSIYDGLNKTEICVLGCEDGKIIVAPLPLPAKSSVRAGQSTFTFKASSSVIGDLSLNSSSHASSTKHQRHNHHHHHHHHSRTNQESPLPTSEAGEESREYELSLTQCKQISLHASIVSAVSISQSGLWIFSTGIDGCIHMLSTLGTDLPLPMANKAQSMGRKDNKGTAVGAEIFENEIVVTDKGEFEVMKKKIFNLNDAIDDLNLSYRQKITFINLDHEKKTSQMTDQWTKDLKMRDDIIVKLKDDLVKLNHEMKQGRRDLVDSYDKKILALEVDHEKKITEELNYVRYMRQVCAEMLLFRILSHKNN